MAYDELVVPSSQAAAALLLFVVPLLFLLRYLATTTTRGRRNDHGKHPPPSPPSLPVIGHLHLVGALPHVSFRDLARKHGPDLMLLRLGAVPTLVVSSPRAAEAVLRTHDHVFASRARSPVADIIFYRSSDVALAPLGEYWRTVRKLVTTHMLSAKKVHSFRHGRQEEVRFAMAKIREAAASAPGTAVDMSELLGSFSNDVVCRAVVGKHLREEGRNKLFRELIEINVSLQGGFNLEDLFPRLATVDVLARVICAKARRISKRWDDLLEKIIDEHAAAKSSSVVPRHHVDDEQQDTGDLIDVLLSRQEHYGLTRDNVKAILLDMFQGGTETAYLTMEFAMAELMRNQHTMAKLQAEVRANMVPPLGGEGADMATTTTEEEGTSSKTAYLKAVVKETLRLHPLVPFLVPHLSTADCQVDGYTIPSGTRVIVNAWALGRDPKYWERPEEFAPERFLLGDGGSAAGVEYKGNDFQLVPFGSGRRICPGINFAAATIEAMLANLVFHFDWELPAAETTMDSTGGIDMTEVYGLTLHRKEKLLLVPRFPAGHIH